MACRSLFWCGYREGNQQVLITICDNPIFPNNRYEREKDDYTWSEEACVGAALAVVMVGASMSSMSGTSQAASGDMTIQEFSWISVGTVTDITPDCVNPGVESSGSWGASPIDCMGETYGCIDVRLRANDAITNLGMGNANETLSSIVIDLNGTTCFPSVGTCRINLNAPKTLYSSDRLFDGLTGKLAGSFQDDGVTNVGPYTLLICSSTLVGFVNAMLGDNPPFAADFYKILEP